MIRFLEGVGSARILDPVSGTIGEPRDVAIRDGRVVAIHPQGAVNSDVPSNRFVDVGGRIVMPGLIDAHVHVTATDGDLGRVSEQSPFYAAAKTHHRLRAMLRRGFTTVRDAGGADFGVAAAVSERLIEGPRVFYGGKALSQTGGHGDFRARGTHVVDHHPCSPSISVICDGVPEVQKAAREQLRTGADHVKMMLSGGVASRADRIDSMQFSDDEVRAVVEEAHAANRYVMAHAYTPEAVNRAVKLGVRSIEHGNLIDESSIQLLKQHDAFLVPNLVAYERVKAEGAKYGTPPEGLEKVDEVLKGGIDSLKLATESGVSVAFGTDLLGGMEEYQSHEFTIRSKVVPSADIVRQATTTGAKLVGMPGELGRIMPGAFADLLVMDANPLEDVTVLADPTRSMHMVIKDGRAVGGET